MKLILEMEPDRMGKALATVFQIIQQNPTQKIGTSYGIETANGFMVIRNKDSYTVRESINVR